MICLLQLPENQLEKNSQLLERIQQVKDTLGFKRDIELANAIKMSSSYLYEILLNKKKVPKTFGQKLEDNLNINRLWFETGEGEMIKANIVRSNSKPLGDINYPFESDDTPFIPLGDGQYIMIVPLVPEYAHAGYMLGYKDPEYIEELPKHTITVSKHHKGIYQAFEVAGDSMKSADYPEESIYDGSIVTGRLIQQNFWKSKFHTHRFKDFVIVHKEGVLTKRIKDHDVQNGKLTLESLNPDKATYPDLEISLNDVYQIFNIVNVSQFR